MGRISSQYLPGKKLKHHCVRVLPSLSILPFLIVSDECIRLCTILEKHTKDWTMRWRFALGGQGDEIHSMSKVFDVIGDHGVQEILEMTKRIGEGWGLQVNQDICVVCTPWTAWKTASSTVTYFNSNPFSNDLWKRSGLDSESIVTIMSNGNCTFNSNCCDYNSVWQLSTYVIVGSFPFTFSMHHWYELYWGKQSFEFQETFWSTFNEWAWAFNFNIGDHWHYWSHAICSCFWLGCDFKHTSYRWQQCKFTLHIFK